MEADLARDQSTHGDPKSEQLENIAPRDCLPPSWNPSMANKTGSPRDMYEDFDRIAPTALPVSAKTLARIPFGALSSGEISKRSLSPTLDGKTVSPQYSPSPSDKCLDSAISPPISIPTSKPTSQERKMRVPREPYPVNGTRTHTQQKPKVTSGNHVVFQDPESTSPRISLSRLSLCDRNSPCMSPLRVLSPNVTLNSQRSPRSPLQKLRMGSPHVNGSKERNNNERSFSPAMAFRKMDVFDQENLSPSSYKSPKRLYDQENLSPFVSPKVARMVTDDYVSPYSGLNGRSKRSQITSKGNNEDLEGYLSYTNDELNETLSESMIQFDNLQLKAQSLISKQENEDPVKILHQLKVIEKKQLKLKQLQENLQKQLLKSTAKKNKCISQSAKKKIPFPLKISDHSSTGDEIKPVGLPTSPKSPPVLPLLDIASIPAECCSLESVQSGLDQPLKDQSRPSTVCMDPLSRQRDPKDETWLLSNSLCSINTSFAAFSPRPKMAGTAQLVDSPFSNDVHNFPAPIRTPLALRNEADMASKLNQAIMASPLSEEPMRKELSIDGVDSSLELSSRDVSGRESTELQSAELQHELSQSTQRHSLCMILDKARYSSPSTLTTNVTSVFQKPVAVPMHGSLSLLENVRAPVFPFNQTCLAISKSVAMTNAAIQYEEALLNEEVSLYACRLYHTDCTNIDRCRPVDPVAKTLDTGDDTVSTL